MNAALRIFAGIIDFLQFIFFIALLGLQLMTPIGAGAVGAVTGAVVCWNFSTGVWEGMLNAGACLLGGGALGAGISALAIPIGMAIDVAISATFGILLILLLWVSGRFSFMAVIMGFAGEMMPGINGFAPFWSILVHRCIKEHSLKQKGGGSATQSVLGVLGSVAKVLPGGGAAAALTPALSMASRATSTALSANRTTTRVPLQTKNFDGIRPANDNRPQSYAQAA